MKKIFLMFILSFWCAIGFAQTMTQNDVKVELIQQMQKDGYLSDKMAQEVKVKYVKVNDLSTVSNSKATMQESTWTQYLSWINLLKVAGIILFLVAFWGTITKIIGKVWFLIVSVPMWVYQTAFLAIGMIGIFVPHLIWESQAFYIALFCSFANIIVIGWIVSTYPKLEEMFAKLFNIGVPVQSVISFWGMIYFGALAFAYASQIFGFFAAVCFSGMLSFGLYYAPGVLTLHFKEKALNAVIFGHTLVLAVYAWLHINNIAPIEVSYFKVGLEYYSTIALGLALLIGSTPFIKREGQAFYFVAFVALVLLSTVGYFFFGLQVICSILCIFFILYVLEIICYYGYKGGLIIGSALLGASLYALSILLEQYGSYIILMVK